MESLRQLQLEQAQPKPDDLPATSEEQITYGKKTNKKRKQPTPFLQKYWTKASFIVRDGHDDFDRETLAGYVLKYPFTNRINRYVLIAVARL